MTNICLDPALKFDENQLPASHRANMLMHFRECGFVTVPHVYLPESIDAYMAQIESLVVPGGTRFSPIVVKMDDPITVYPAKAPRLLDVLRGTFMPWAGDTHPVLFHPSWVVKPANPDPDTVLDWHKDGDQAGVTMIHGYSYPSRVHIAIYFEDMTPELGPTYVIPRSHRDATLSPFSGAREEPFLPRKGDVVVWDQRLWHRASARTEPGLRIVAIFGFFGTPGPFQLSKAQTAALASAGSEEERTLFGGPTRV